VRGRRVARAEDRKLGVDATGLGDKAAGEAKLPWFIGMRNRELRWCVLLSVAIEMKIAVTRYGVSFTASACSVAAGAV